MLQVQDVDKEVVVRRVTLRLRPPLDTTANMEHRRVETGSPVLPAFPVVLRTWARHVPRPSRTLLTGALRLRPLAASTLPTVSLPTPRRRTEVPPLTETTKGLPAVPRRPVVAAT